MATCLRKVLEQMRFPGPTASVENSIVERLKQRGQRFDGDEGPREFLVARLLGARRAVRMSNLLTAMFRALSKLLVPCLRRVADAPSARRRAWRRAAIVT